MKKLLLLTLSFFTSILVFGQCTVWYVTANGSPTATGTIDDPKSITNAFSNATDGMVIRIAADTFYLDAPLTINANNIVIEGGFLAEDDWTKTSLQGATTLMRTTNVPEGLPNQQRLVALQAFDKSGFEVHDVTIKTEDADQPGMSTYGVYLSNCSTYKFVRCQINAGNAANGLAGTPGEAGGNGTNGFTGSPGSCDGGDCTFGSGQAGGAGGAGGSGAAGSGGGAGGSQTNNQQNPGQAGVSGTGRNGGGGGGGGAGGDECTSNNGGVGGAGGASACAAGATGGNRGSDGDPGTDGFNGANGSNGTAGANGTDGPAGDEVGGFWVAGGQGGNGADGCGGAGGGGGGGGGRQVCTFCDNGPGNGGSGGGGGGQGGTGGTGGYGGGSSFGVYVRQNGASASFIDCKVTGATAGQGGAGGAGGDGGAGGAGGAKQSSCSGEIGEGGAGGNGGAGGAGGNGGNGANGISANVQLASGESFTVLSTNYNLTGQPEIRVSYVKCYGPNVEVYNTTFAEGEDITTWTFGSNASPSAGTANPQVTAYTAAGFNNIVNGTNTYRAFVYYCCESLAEVTEIPLEAVSVYPNPTGGQFSVDLGSMMNEVVVTVADMNGRIVFENTYFNTANEQIYLDQPAGVYFVKVATAEHAKVIKLIKQ